MRCLWLTLADPEPAENGQMLYSNGLIHAAASAGAELDVIGLARPGGRHADGERTGAIRWWLAPHDIPSRWTGLLSPVPRVARRTCTATMRRMLDARLAQDRWDAIVFDSICQGWGIDAIRRRYAGRRRPLIAYLAHNHEEDVARAIAAGEREMFKRRLKEADLRKVVALERALCDHADLITSNTPEDRGKFQACWPEKPVAFMPAGYAGPRVERRTISAALPRRAVIVGTFDWPPKQASLQAFLAAAAAPFAAAGIALYVVGAAESAFLDRLRARHPAVTFTGRVDDVSGYMADSRLALVPDTLGGFKLKALDYVFHRLPILAIDGSVPGMPLTRDESILLYPDHAALARAVIGLIDDFPRLNTLHERAYAACRDAFDWGMLGRRLIAAVTRDGTAHHMRAARAATA